MTKRNAADYLYQGGFDRAIVRTQFTTEFASKPKFNAGSADQLIELLGMIEGDSKITDIRWMAYMLGTVYLESSRTVPKQITTKDKKGNVQTKTIKVWQNFVPVEEVGYSVKDYGKPVKVTKRPDGKAVITEWDGDQWLVNASGSYDALNPKDKPEQGFRAKGQIAPTKPGEVYEKQEGDEHYYFGRGYVQLTWWSNYAAAGKMLDRGLDFLFDPDLVNDPKVAYAVLSAGMRTGGAFANRQTLAKFFHDDVTNYVGARAMVNANADAKEVAEFAELFEKILFEARLKPLVTKQ